MCSVPIFSSDIQPIAAAVLVGIDYTVAVAIDGLFGVQDRVEKAAHEAMPFTRAPIANTGTLIDWFGER